MLLIILVFFNSCFFVNSDKLPVEIVINIRKDQNWTKFEDPTTKIALLNHPLNIIVKDYKVSDVRCWHKLNQQSFETYFEKSVRDGQSSFTIKVESVKQIMSSKWDCVIQSSDIIQKQHIIFNLHVRGAKKVQVKINGEPQVFKLTDLSVTQYDGIANYWYESGETIDLSCKDKEKNGQLSIRYEDSHGTEMFKSSEVNSEYPLYFSGVTRRQNDNDFIDCSYLKRNITYTYRTIFKFKDETTEVFFDITINNLRLFPIQKSEDKYIYKFFEEEILEISCEKRDKNKPGIIMFSGDDDKVAKNIAEIDAGRNPWKKTIQFSTKDLEMNHLKCINNNNNTKPHKIADILFIQDGRDPYIGGLSQEDIVYQYSENDTVWMTHYRYNVGDKLTITCASKRSYDDLFIHGEGLYLNKPRYAKNITYELTFTENYRKLITCETEKDHGSRKAVIVLHEQKIIPDSPHTEEDLVLIISCTLTGCLIVIIVIGLTFWWRVNKNNNITKDSYENLVHQIQTPIPTFPSQWTTRPFANGVMLENTLYNSSGPACASADRRENDNINEYHYIEVNDEIMKKHKELLKEHMAEMINESNTEYIQPYASSSLANICKDKYNNYVNNKNESYRNQNSASENAQFNFHGDENRNYNNLNIRKENEQYITYGNNKNTNYSSQNNGRENAEYNNESYCNWNTGTENEFNIKDAPEKNKLREVIENNTANNSYCNEIANLQPNTNILYSNVTKDLDTKDSTNNWYNN